MHPFFTGTLTLYSCAGGQGADFARYSQTFSACAQASDVICASWSREKKAKLRAILRYPQTEASSAAPRVPEERAKTAVVLRP